MMKTVKFYFKKNMIAAMLVPDEVELGFVSLTVGQATLDAFKSDMQVACDRFNTLNQHVAVTQPQSEPKSPEEVKSEPELESEVPVSQFTADTRTMDFANNVFLSKTETDAVVKTRYMTYKSPIETPEVAVAQAITGYGFKVRSPEYDELMKHLMGRWNILKAFDATQPKLAYDPNELKVEIVGPEFRVTYRDKVFKSHRDEYEKLFKDLVDYFGAKSGSVKEYVSKQLRTLLTVEAAPSSITTTDGSVSIDQREPSVSVDSYGNNLSDLPQETDPIDVDELSSSGEESVRSDSDVSSWKLAFERLDEAVVSALFLPNGKLRNLCITRAYGSPLCPDTFTLRIPVSKGKSPYVRSTVKKPLNETVCKYVDGLRRHTDLVTSDNAADLCLVLEEYLDALLKQTTPAAKGVSAQSLPLEKFLQHDDGVVSSDLERIGGEEFPFESLPQTLVRDLLLKKNVLTRAYHDVKNPDTIKIRFRSKLFRMSVKRGLDKLTHSATYFILDSLVEEVDKRLLRKVVHFMLKCLLENTSVKRKGARFEAFDFAAMKPKAEVVDVVEVDAKPSVEVTESSYVPVETPAVTLAGFTVPAALDRLSQVPKGTDFARKNWPWFFDASGTFDLLELLKVDEQYYVSVKPRPKGGKYKCDGKRINVEIDRTYDSIRSAVWAAYCSAVMGTGLDNHPQVESVFKEYIDAFTVATMLELSLHDTKFTKDSKASWYLDFSEETEREVIIDRITYPSGRLRVVSVGKAIDGVFWYIKGNTKGYGPNLAARRIRFDAKPVEEQIDELTSDLMLKTKMPEDNLLRRQLRSIIRTEAKRVGNGLI